MEVASTEVLGRIFRLTVVLSGSMNQDLAARGLTRARATLMAHLHRHGPTIQSALAHALGVSRRNITGLVGGLEESGLVKRDRHPTDGRALLVSLTTDGSRAAAALARDERELARFLLAGRASVELESLANEFDDLLARLSEPGYTMLRQSALRRWPVRRPSKRHR